MNEYVPYEIAKLLKEKGFNIPTHAFYNSNKGYRFKFDSCLINRNAGIYVSAPIYQSVFAWFRTYYIYAWIEPYSMDIDGEALDFKYCMFVEDNYEESNSNYHTFEEAENECIKYICKYYI